MTKPVFISYSTDDTAAAEQIRDGLESGDGNVAGIGCWMAPRDIAPGLEYGSQIVAAIEECALDRRAWQGPLAVRPTTRLAFDSNDCQIDRGFRNRYNTHAVSHGGTPRHLNNFPIAVLCLFCTSSSFQLLPNACFCLPDRHHSCSYFSYSSQ